MGTPLAIGHTMIGVGVGLALAGLLVGRWYDPYDAYHQAVGGIVLGLGIILATVGLCGWVAGAMRAALGG